MAHNLDAYKIGMAYEVFMSRAFNHQDTSKSGHHGSVIQNLMTIESGDTTFKKWHGSFDKQLAAAKKYMSKAFDKYLMNPRLKDESKNELDKLRNSLLGASSSAELVDIIIKSNNITLILTGD